MKYKEKLLALKLRKKGLSYKEILKRMKVSKSTLSVWLRDVDLTTEQKNQLLNKMERTRYEISKRKVADRKKRTEIIIEEAKKEIDSLSKDLLFFVGIAIYWAEGAKNQTEAVKFANSDEKMILLIMKWLREICRVPEKKFKVHIHMHTLHVRKDIIKYWSGITGVPTNQFYRPYVKSTSLGQRRNILYNGTCSIIIHDKNLFRKILGWKIGMQNYFGI